MILFQVLFYVLAALTLAGGVGVVAAGNVVHSGLFLILSLAAVAGIYLVMFSDFLALVQVLLYSGAVIILILFAMMLTRVREVSLTLDNPQRPWAAVASVIVFAILAAGMLATPWGAAEPPNYISFVDIGTSLFTQWAVPFEVASLVLLIALMGAIIIARSEEHE